MLTLGRAKAWEEPRVRVSAYASAAMAEGRGSISRLPAIMAGAGGHPYPASRWSLVDCAFWGRVHLAVAGGLAVPRKNTLIQHETAPTHGQIDRLVYELYGLSEEEIAIVEEATGS